MGAQVPNLNKRNLIKFSQPIQRLDRKFEGRSETTKDKTRGRKKDLGIEDREDGARLQHQNS